MNDLEMTNLEDGLQRSRQFSQQQSQNAVAISLSALLVYWICGFVVPWIPDLGLAIAAATGFSVAVWCQPNAYRRQNGSLKLAILLSAVLWLSPVVVLLTWYFSTT